MTRIRYAWSSLRVLPYFLAVAALASITLPGWDRGGPWILLTLAFLLVLAIQQLTTARFVLGEHWMRIPGPAAWYECVVPSVGLLGALTPDPGKSDARLVRLADVASWTGNTDGFELRMRDGTARVVRFHGIRPRDARRVIEYLYSRIGDRGASKDG